MVLKADVDVFASARAMSASLGEADNFTLQRVARGTCNRKTLSQNRQSICKLQLHPQSVDRYLFL